MHQSMFETTSINSYWHFLQLINWREPWLIALGGFHAICLLMIVLTRGHHNIQIFIFLALLCCIFCAEQINQIAAKKWQLFAEDQYFDSRGMFISTVLSTPVILNCCVLVGLWLYESVSLLKICVKQMKRSRVQQSTTNETKKNVTNEKNKIE